MLSHRHRKCGILCLCKKECVLQSEFVERFPELPLFYGLSSPLDSEMICVSPYFALMRNPQGK